MDIKARLPGQIIDLKVSVGDTVKVKSILAVIEALKMERPVPCPVDGTVGEIKVSVGDKVMSGQTIMVID